MRHPRHARPVEPTAAGRATRISAVLAVAVAALLVLGGGVAFGYFFATNSAKPAKALAGSVGAGAKPTAVVSGRDVTVSWGTATNATGYTIARTNVTPGSLPSTLHGTCATTVSGTTCTDAGLPATGTSSTTWTYTVTPTHGSWNGTTSSASTTVTIPGPSLSLTTTTFSESGGTTTASVAHFFDTEGVTFCLDTASTTCTPTKTLGTTTVPSTGGAKTNVSLTIPADLTSGTNTIYAIGSLGSHPSATIAVDPSPATHLFFTSAALTMTATTSATHAVTVQERNASTSPVTATGTVQVTLSSTSSGAKFAATTGGASVTHVTITSGHSSVTFFYGDRKAGTPTITASHSGFSPRATQQESVKAGAADHITAVSGGGQHAFIGEAFADPLVAKVTDAFGNPVEGVSVTFTGPAYSQAGPPSATFTSTSSGTCNTKTNATGDATSGTLNANTNEGSYTIVATATGVTGTVTFKETNTGLA